jgi:hypothetical protein
LSCPKYSRFCHADRGQHTVQYPSSTAPLTAP